MPRPSIDQLRAVGDFATLFRWNLAFPSFPTAVAAPPTSDSLNLRCETMEVPKASNESMTIAIRGHKVKQPGMINYPGTLSITFVETIDNTIKTFLKNWREAIYSTGTGVSADLKSALQCSVQLTQLNNQDVGIWSYTLIGCYLEDYDLGSVDGQSSDVHKPSMTLSYDYFKDGAIG